MKKIKAAIIAILTLPTFLLAELAQDEVKMLAQQYAEACMNKDFKVWQSMYYKPSETSEVRFKNALQGAGSGVMTQVAEPKNIRIKKVDGRNVYLQIQSQNGHRDDGWLQLLPDGKVKYDPIICPHPIIQVFDNYAFARMYSDDSGQRVDELRKMCIAHLLETGIPTFGLKIDSPNHAQFKALDDIEEWLDENGDKWDVSEPHVFCPKEQFRDCLKKL